jgi:hypothetical protein
LFTTTVWEYYCWQMSEMSCSFGVVRRRNHQPKCNMFSNIYSSWACLGCSTSSRHASQCLKVCISFVLMFDTKK